MIEFVRRFRPLLDSPTRRRLVLSCIGAIGVSLFEAGGLILLVPLVELIASSSNTIPPSAQWVADILGHPTPLTVAAALGVIVFFLFAIKGVSSLLFLRWNLGFILEREAAMSTRLLDRYLRAPYMFHLGHNSADLLRTLHEDVRRVYQEGLVSLLGATADAVLIVAIATVLLVVDPIVALCGGAYFVLVGFAYQRLIHGRAHAAGAVIHVRLGEAYRVVQQSLGAVKDIQIRHRQKVFVDELYRVKRSASKRFRTLILFAQAPRYFLEIALIVGVGLMAAIVYPLRSRTQATAVLSLFVAAGFRLLPSLNRILVALTSVRGSQAPLNAVAADLELLESTEAIDDPSPDRQALGPVPIEFESVSFRYTADGPEVLRNVSFQIQPGESVAFVGPSGAGKSTLLDILLGLLQPESGVVRVGGRPMSEVRDSWQRSIGYVPQDVVLLDESLRTNVALGTPPEEIDDARVEEALALAELTAVWRSLPDGLETKVGERGTRLSGGQCQRVGISRALYDGPAILILDEATSSLDSSTESRITDTIDSLQRKLTLVIDTHRLSTVRNCDRVYLLETGELVGSGGFDDLAATNTTFAELVRHSSVAQHRTARYDAGVDSDSNGDSIRLSAVEARAAQGDGG